MTDLDTIWVTLGIEPTSSIDAIRRAYAAKLRHTRPESDARAFQLLRAALEAALASAANEKVAATDRSDQAAQAVASDFARSRTQQLAALQAIYGNLKALLMSEPTADDASLLRVTRALLDTIQLAEIEVAASCEISLAHLVLEFKPRADGIIPEIAAKLGWVKRAADWNANAIFQAVVERAGALEFLAKLAVQPSSAGRALRFLMKPHRAATFRLALVWDSTLEQTVSRLLSHIRGACPAALELLDQSAVAWWSSYVERSRLRPNALDACAIGASLTLPLVAIVLPVSPISDALILAAIALTALWAVVVRKPSRLGAQDTRWLRPALALLFNLPLAIWWACALLSSNAGTDARVACAIAGTLFTHAFARRRLIEWWVLRLNEVQRRCMQGAMAILAFASLAAAVGSDRVMALSVTSAVVMAVSLLHRMPASQLSAIATRTRVGVTLATWTALSVLLVTSKLDELATLRMGAVLFASGVLITLALCLSGETPEADALRLRNRESS